MAWTPNHPYKPASGTPAGGYGSGNWAGGPARGAHPNKKTLAEIFDRKAHSERGSDGRFLMSEKGDRKAARSAAIEDRLFRVGMGLVDGNQAIGLESVPEAGRGSVAVSALMGLHSIYNGKPAQMTLNATTNLDDIAQLSDDQLAERMANAQRKLLALSRGAHNGDDEPTHQE